MHARTHLHARALVNTYGPLVALGRSSLLAARSRSLPSHALAFCWGLPSFVLERTRKTLNPKP